MSKKGELVLDFIGDRADQMTDFDVEYMLDVLYDNNVKKFDSYSKDVDWEIAEYRTRI
tara:strand:+ start:635 stop:808 length:174 start_codon:yes stop_codon:yes gene_type:complete